MSPASPPANPNPSRKKDNDMPPIMHPWYWPDIHGAAWLFAGIIIGMILQRLLHKCGL
jgi:hypothetical protein